MEYQQSITVLGGSAASSFTDAQKISWPYLLKAELPDSIKFKIETRPNLTFVRALNELLDFPDEDLLILHFGTSIGWPISLVAIGHKLGIDFSSEVSFHQAAHKSSGLMNRQRKRSRARFRNTVKYLLFFLGLYKSRVSRREIADQIDTVVHLASKQSKRIIWVQHQALQNRRIYLERHSYKKCYREILSGSEKHESATFALVTLPNEFLIQENYLLDCVHLSEKGHRQLADLLKVTFKKF